MILELKFEEEFCNMRTILYDIISKEFMDDKDNNIEYKLNEEIFFDTYEFHNYHKKNCDQLYRVINMKKNKIIASYYIAKKGESICMPYSSPFSYIICQTEISYKEFNSIIDGMKKLCQLINCENIKITLPPTIYNNEIETQFLMFINNGFNIKYIDINHYFNLNEFKDEKLFVEKLTHAQRKNYKKSKSEKLKFQKIDNSKFIEAFEIIEINRRERGYPLRMQRQQIQDIINFKNSTVDFFIVENSDNIKIAAAMVYKINDEVCQVVYWGHLDKFGRQRPMSLLSIELCKYYKKAGYKYLDIGPSSELGNISINLAQFKVDIGCKNISKFTLEFKNKG